MGLTATEQKGRRARPPIMGHCNTHGSIRRREGEDDCAETGHPRHATPRHGAARHFDSKQQNGAKTKEAQLRRRVRATHSIATAPFVTMAAWTPTTSRTWEEDEAD